MMNEREEDRDVVCEQHCCAGTPNSKLANFEYKYNKYCCHMMYPFFTIEIEIIR